MFRLNEKVEGLDLPGRKITRVYRSLSDSSVAIPGTPSQAATAYLCAFSGRNGVFTAVALHLHTSRRVAFYFHDGGETSGKATERAWEEGIHFSESMGFMLGDLDFHLLSPSDRDALWDTLPLRKGGLVPGETRSGRDVGPQPPPEVAPTTASEKETAMNRSEKTSAGPVSDSHPVAAGANVVRSIGEMKERRKKFVENMGRFLASL